MKTRILIVDDDVGAARLLKLRLETSGPFEVAVESRAARVLATARHFRPDLILLDVVMPERDGGDVAARLRADPDLAHTAIVFLTALVAGEEQPGEKLMRGGFRFLAKPVSLPDVISCIEEELLHSV